MELSNKLEIHHEKYRIRTSNCRDCYRFLGRYRVRHISIGDLGHIPDPVPDKANGSLTTRDGKVIGSELLARISQIRNTFILALLLQEKRL